MSQTLRVNENLNNLMEYNKLQSSMDEKSISCTGGSVRDNYDNSFKGDNNTSFKVADTYLKTSPSYFVMEIIWKNSSDVTDNQCNYARLSQKVQRSFMVT